MNIQQLINNEELKKDNYLKKDQFERRRLLSKYILQHKDCKIGIPVICFEDENIVAEKNKFFYNKQQSKNNKIKYVTIGKQYQVIDFDNVGIKIINDKGCCLWYTMNRFIYSLQIERKEKLQKLQNINND